ncbi:hypothetical protein BaRGS_00014287 [Batillaria attramentaria]|uniref:Uncharacterized protein n=1 Tax=Batillaria attramentaria TaxID=370345 RepID=A0ABD0L5H6_9CAEN
MAERGKQIPIFVRACCTSSPKLTKYTSATTHGERLLDAQFQSRRTKAEASGPCLIVSIMQHYLTDQPK